VHKLMATRVPNPDMGNEFPGGVGPTIISVGRWARPAQRSEAARSWLSETGPLLQSRDAIYFQVWQGLVYILHDGTDDFRSRLGLARC
jgi:hypothetical protein